MSTKEKVIKIIEELPDNVTLEDTIREISIKAKVNNVLHQPNN